MPFEEKNIAEDPKAAKELSGLGATKVPVVVVGDEVISGFERSKLDKVLEPV